MPIDPIHNDGYSYDYRPYSIPLKSPLNSHHGVWLRREGIYIRLENERGQVGFGEIAPLPWFGSESIEAALGFCQGLPRHITAATIQSISDDLPACQFGFGTAWEAIAHIPYAITLPLNTLNICGLLPAGKDVLTAWQALWQEGYRTFKWKIGVHDHALEKDLFHTLIAELPTRARLRLDANGGLTQETARDWLATLDGIRPPDLIEFLEQPLPPQAIDELMALAHDYHTPIALDEAIASVRQLWMWHHRGWPGIYVLKPGILGFPERLRQFCQYYRQESKLVFSSVLEGAIARTAIFHLIQGLELESKLALGFGIDPWRSVPLLTHLTDYEKLWHGSHQSYER